MNFFWAPLSKNALTHNFDSQSPPTVQIPLPEKWDNTRTTMVTAIDCNDWWSLVIMLTTAQK